MVNSHLAYFIRLQLNYIFNCQMTHVSSIHTLTIYHKLPTSQKSIAQGAEDEINSSAGFDTRQDCFDRWKARPRRLISCSRAYLHPGIPNLSIQRQVVRSEIRLGNSCLMSVSHGRDCLEIFASLTLNSYAKFAPMRGWITKDRFDFCSREWCVT